MSLQEKLDDIKAGFSAQVPDAAKAVMSESLQNLLDSNQVAKTPQAGDTFPSFSLSDANGTAQTLTELSEGALVLSFFRGFW